jgi:hypothetical protein
MLLWLSIAELHCGAVVVSHRALESSPGWLHCLPLASIVLGALREGAPVAIAVVSTAMGVLPCCWRCEDKLAV